MEPTEQSSFWSGLSRRGREFARWLLVPEDLASGETGPAAAPAGGEAFFRWLLAAEPLEEAVVGGPAENRSPSGLRWLLTSAMLEPPPPPETDPALVLLQSPVGPPGRGTARRAPTSRSDKFALTER